MTNRENIIFLQKTMAFREMSGEEIAEALADLQAEEKAFEKGETVMYAGNRTTRMGLVLEGSVNVESNDVWGNRTLLGHVGKGQFFAETYALLEDEAMQVDVTANEKSRILLLNVGSAEAISRIRKSWSTKFLTNMLTLSLHKNLMLSRRSFHTSPKTIRGRVMSYLYSVSLQKHNMEFDIPFDRQQLADYLNLDRSALSKELGRMQADGILVTRKNHFIIKKEDMK